jgi:hypothetical protein
MGNRFRASLGHRGCVLAVATVVVFLVPVTAAGQVREDAATNSSCTKSHTLSKSVDFADLHRAQKTLGHKYRWARQLSEFEMGARQRTAEPTTLKEFLDFAAGAARSWTAVEKANWQILVDKSSDALKGLNVHVPNIDLITTSGEEEFGAAYTRWRKKCFTFCRERILFCGMTSMRFSDSRPWMDSNTPPSSRIVASATGPRSSTYTQ